MESLRVVLLGLAVALSAHAAAAQVGRDFVFTDADGHLVLRFPGTTPDANQLEEMSNVHLSTMVHDRLRADFLFEAEHLDAEWAHPMESQLEQLHSSLGREFSKLDAECRSASCRLVLEHSPTFEVAAHQALMGIAQRVFQEFIEANPGSFERVSLMTGHYQEPDPPFMKVFLQRARK